VEGNETSSGPPPGGSATFSGEAPTPSPQVQLRPELGAPVRGRTIFRIRGVDVHLDPSWGVIAVLITINLWTVFADRDSAASVDAVSAAGFAVLGAFLFFGSILLHELAHAAVARRRGIPVEGITLYVFGGATHTKNEFRGPRDEFWVAIVGPATSLALGVLFLGVHHVAGSARTGPYGLLLSIVADTNIGLGLFNLLPGFPLDGGRLLRSGIWEATGRLPLATVVAARVGQGFALLLIVGSLALAAVQQRATILWLTFIAWMLWRAATATLARGRDAEASHVPVDEQARKPRPLSPTVVASMLLILGSIAAFAVYSSGVTDPGGALNPTLIKDDFSAIGGWPTADSPAKQVGIVDGTYRILLRRPRQEVAPAKYFREKTFPAVSVQVVARRVVSTTLPEGFGLGCVIDGAAGIGYVFLIDPDADLFAIIRSGENAKAVALGRDLLSKGAAWSRSGRNVVRGDCFAGSSGRPTMLVMYVNGHRVLTGNDDASLGPFSGMTLVASSTEGGTEVRFDDASMKRLSPDARPPRSE
jgi:Zn-dependent protease